MEKEFVSYEEALELKELGFNEPCIMQWTYAPELIFCTSTWAHPKLKTNKESYSDSGGDCISAPTFSQAFRWFDEVHGLTSTIDWMTRKQPSHSGYIVYFRGKEIPLNDENFLPIYGDTLHGMYVFKTRPEAELACLRQLIKIVKNG